jgi:hypothetical protein
MENKAYCIKTVPDADDMYNCTGCNHKPFKRYGSYKKHAEKCLLGSSGSLRMQEDSSPTHTKKKVKLSVNISRKLITENKELIIQLQNEGKDHREARWQNRAKLDDMKLEITILREEKSALEQKVELLAKTVDSLNGKNIEFLQFMENFSIEFLKTRDFDF